VDDWLIAAVVVVPLLAGLSLISALARGIFNNPAVANGNVALLAVAALLCIAPTLVNLAVTLPNGTKISLVKQQLTDAVGTQGGEIKQQIEALRRRVATLEKERGPAAATAVATTDPNSGKVVVVLYAEERKDLAVEIQNYLLQQGYSANAVYTDFTELSDANRLPSGSVAIVSAETNAPLRGEVDKVLKAKFPQLKNSVDSGTPKVVGTSIQVRLF
jgi:hypothetical protein